MEDEEGLGHPEADFELIAAVEAHFEPIFGAVERVFHEEGSRFVHIDIHRFEPLDDGVQAYVTTGMASRPMNVPAAVPDPGPYRYAELLLFLPPEWPRDWETLGQPPHFWPLRELTNVARLPHANETWVWGGHTVGNDPCLPFAEDTGLCATLVSPSYLLPEEFETLSLDDGRNVVFLTLAFLYPEEREHARSHGSDSLMRHVRAAGLSPSDFFILNTRRPSVIASGASGG